MCLLSPAGGVDLTPEDCQWLLDPKLMASSAANQAIKTAGRIGLKNTFEQSLLKTVRDLDKLPFLRSLNLFDSLRLYAHGPIPFGTLPIVYPA